MRTLFALLCSLLLLGAQPKGALFLVGGGKVTDELVDTFITLAGGKGAVIGILPAASHPDDQVKDFDAWEPRVAKAGGKLVRLPCRHREDAQEASNLEAAKACTGFWIPGGDQKRVNQRLVGTPLHQVLVDRYLAGAVVGGTSAGAAAMGRTMITGENLRGFVPARGEGDDWNPRPGTFATASGLGLLPGLLVDTHVIPRKRYNRLFSLIMEFPTHVGVGLDESTALLVTDHRATVVGDGYVFVVDPSAMGTQQGFFQDARVHMLGRGYTLDLSTRSVTPPGPHTKNPGKPSP